MSLSMINILKLPSECARVCASMCVHLCVCVLIWHINQSTRLVGKSKSRPSFDMSSKVSPRIRTRTRLMLPVRDRNPVPHFAIAIQIFPSGCSLTNCQTSSWQLAAPHKLPVGCQVAWAAAPCHFHFDSDLILMDMLDANNKNYKQGEQQEKHVSHCIFYCR